MNRMKSWFAKPVDITIEDHMVISQELAKNLKYIMKTAGNIKENGGTFENVLLFGPPGTGKTLFAQLLAQHCGMDYAIVPAANISQFLVKGTAVEELNNLFEWAAKSSRGTIIFFDEAETFLGNRKNLEDKAQNALSAFLAKTGTPSDKIMIICATNRPSVLDEAVLSRLQMKVEFALPDLNARVDQLVMHIKAIFGQQKGKVVDYAYLENADNVKSIATGLEKSSGRAIQQFVNRLRQRALAENTLVIDKELVDRVVAEFCTKIVLKDL